MEFLTKYFYVVDDIPAYRVVGLLCYFLSRLPLALWQKVVLSIIPIITAFRKDEVVDCSLQWPTISLPSIPEEDRRRIMYFGTWFVLLIAGAIGLCLFYYMMRLLLSVLKKMVSSRRYKIMRSYRPEAMRDGSLFEPGRIPSCQVKVSEVGIFSNSLVGFGLRMEDYLVLPTHVLESVDWPSNDLVLGEGRKSMLLDMERFQDPLFDVSFFLLTPAQWALLGVSKGSYLNSVAVDGSRVWCTGMKGRTHGVVKQSSPGMYTYSGSTLPGMSGAAYESQGGILGMHVGASGSQNLGISSVYLWRRQELLIMEESKRNRGVAGLAAYEDPGALMEQARARWAVEDINDLLHASRMGDKSVYNWFDKHSGVLGIPKYKYEDDAPKVVKRVTEQVVTPTVCSCKNLFHECEELRGKSNVSTALVKGLTPEGYVGQADNPVSVEPTIGQVLHSVRMLEGAYDDSRQAIVRLTEENQELRDQVAFLGKRLTVLEVWAIDRGYASIPKEVLSPGSPQQLALANRKRMTPDIPKSQRKSALPLKSKDYAGESSKKIVTPPLVRKLKKAFTKAEVPKAIELKETEHQTYKNIRDKKERTEEEQVWMQQFLQKRAEKRKGRRARRAHKSASSQSSSSSTQ